MGERLAQELVGLGPDRLPPFLFDLRVNSYGGTVQPPSAGGEPDDPGTVVGRVAFQYEIAKAFQVTQQVVDSLLRDLYVRGYLARASPVGAGPAEQGDVGWPHIVEPGGANTRVNPGADLVQAKAQKGADWQRRRRRLPIRERADGSGG